MSLLRGQECIKGLVKTPFGIYCWYVGIAPTLRLLTEEEQVSLVRWKVSMLSAILEDTDSPHIKNRLEEWEMWLERLTKRPY